MRKVWGCTEMSAALFDLDNDGTLEILISGANIKKITRVTVAEPGRKTAKIFLPDVPPLESEWELNPGRAPVSISAARNAISSTVWPLNTAASAGQG